MLMMVHFLFLPAVSALMPPVIAAVVATITVLVVRILPWLVMRGIHLDVCAFRAFLNLTIITAVVTIFIWALLLDIVPIIHVIVVLIV